MRPILAALTVLLLVSTPAWAQSGSVAPGTAGTRSELVGGVFNSVTPQMFNGQQAAMQLDSQGRLMVNTGGTFTLSAAALSFSLADGADVTQGATTDTPWLGSGSATVVSILKAIWTKLGSVVATVSGNVSATNFPTTISTGTGGSSANTPRVTVANDSSVIVNGPAAAGSAPGGNPLQLGGVYTTAAPTLSNNQMGNLRVDTNGNLMVNLNAGSPAGGGTGGSVTQGTSPWVSSISQFGGSNVVTGTGVGGAGIPRVTVSSDSSVSATQGTSPWVNNTTQFGGTNLSTGVGASGTGIPRVTVANDSNVQVNGNVAAGSSDSGNPVKVGGVHLTSPPALTNSQRGDLQVDTSGNLMINNAAYIDACPSIIPIAQSASADLKTSTNKIHICGVLLVTSSAQNFSLTEGTGTLCATGAQALIGSTTVLSGASLAGNGGFSIAAGSPVLATQKAADHLCLLQSSTGTISGYISYVDR